MMVRLKKNYQIGNKKNSKKIFPNSCQINQWKTLIKSNKRIRNPPSQLKRFSQFNITWVLNTGNATVKRYTSWASPVVILSLLSSKIKDQSSTISMSDGCQLKETNKSSAFSDLASTQTLMNLAKVKSSEKDDRWRSIYWIQIFQYMNH